MCSARSKKSCAPRCYRSYTAPTSTFYMSMEGSLSPNGSADFLRRHQLPAVRGLCATSTHCLCFAVRTFWRDDAVGGPAADVLFGARHLGAGVDGCVGGVAFWSEYRPGRYRRCYR